VTLCALMGDPVVRDPRWMLTATPMLLPLSPNCVRRAFASTRACLVSWSTRARMSQRAGSRDDHEPRAGLVTGLAVSIDSAVVDVCCPGIASASRSVARIIAIAAGAHRLLRQFASTRQELRQPRELDGVERHGARHDAPQQWRAGVPALELLQRCHYQPLRTEADDDIPGIPVSESLGDAIQTILGTPLRCDAIHRHERGPDAETGKCAGHAMKPLHKMSPRARPRALGHQVVMCAVVVRPADHRCPRLVALMQNSAPMPQLGELDVLPRWAGIDGFGGKAGPMVRVIMYPARQVQRSEPLAVRSELVNEQCHRGRVVVEDLDRMTVPFQDQLLALDEQPGWDRLQGRCQFQDGYVVDVVALVVRAALESKARHVPGNRHLLPTLLPACHEVTPCAAFRGTFPRLLFLRGHRRRGGWQAASRRAPGRTS